VLFPARTPDWLSIWIRRFTSIRKANNGSPDDQ
jgi:hypothetical protein